MALGLKDRLALAVRIAVGGNLPTGPASSLFLSSTSNRQNVRHSAENFLRAYSEMPWLRATVHRLAESVSSVRWRVFALRRGSKFQQAYWARDVPDVRRKATYEAKQAGELVEIEDTPLLRALHFGNPQMTGGNTRRVTQIYLDLVGEAFWLLERNMSGVPEHIWPVPPSWVKSTPSQGNLFYEVSFREFQENISIEDIVWFRDPNPLNPYGRGTGVTGALADELEIDEYAAKYVKGWFERGGTPPLVVSPPTQNGNQGFWTDTQRRQLETSWNQRHRGYMNAFRAMFSPVPIEIQQLAHSFREQQLGELRKQERDTIVQILGIPPSILGIVESGNSFARVDADMFLYQSLTIVPRLELQRETIQERLVPQYDDRLIVEYDNPVPADKEFQLNAARAQPQSLTQNEWRELAGFDPIDSGDVHHVPVNIVPTLDLTTTPIMGFDTENSRGTRSTEMSQKGFTSTDRNKILFVDDAPDDEFYLVAHRAADKATPRVAKLLREAFEVRRDAVSLESLIAALATGLPDEVVSQVNWGLLGESIRGVMEDADLKVIDDAGTLSSQEMDTLFGLSISFREASPEAAAYARNHAALLVTRIEEVSRDAIRQAATRAFTEGATPARVAQEIRGIIGLTANQEEALAKFRALLVEQGQPEDVILRRVERRADAMLRRRSTMIARHELLDSANAGQEFLWAQAREDGVLNPQRFRRFWVLTFDERLEAQCEETEAMNSEGVGFDEMFRTTRGLLRRPPLHVQCRCTQRIVEVSSS